MHPYRLKELVSYEAESGLFRWKVKTSNRVNIGSVAGYKDPKGYIFIRLDGVLHRAHRLAWLYIHGEWPKDEIDHINGDPSDNKASNLREITGALNKQNQRKARKDNARTGVLGVYPNGKGYMASIQVNGRTHYLGTHKTVEKAYAAYVEAKRRLHPAGTL